MPKANKVYQKPTKCAKSCESMPKAEKVWESVPTVEKVWERMPKAEKVWVSLYKFIFELQKNYEDTDVPNKRKNELYYF